MRLFATQMRHRAKLVKYSPVTGSLAWKPVEAVRLTGKELEASEHPTTLAGSSGDHISVVVPDTPKADDISPDPAEPPDAKGVRLIVGRGDDVTAADLLVEWKALPVHDDVVEFYGVKATIDVSQTSSKNWMCPSTS